MKHRTNLDMCQVIENGLIVDEVEGSIVAWKYLVEHQVPTPIILRILTSPSRRRETDPAHAIRPA